ncbi:MAG: radical SAM protein [Eubacteriales bacterium]|nr:radical SAM protein [Eubacteriales bacterium]
MKEINKRLFTNGAVYVLYTEDNYPIEVTDTFLPYYTKDAIEKKQNMLTSYDIGNRGERYLIGISCMSGCPVKCKFCATGKLKKWRNLTAEEIVEQVKFITQKNVEFPFTEAKEHKINYTRMGEPFLNIDNVRRAVEKVEFVYPGTHHYISTVGIKGSDFSWIKENITLQVSLHSLDEERRNELIPYPNKMTIEELGQIRTQSNLKTTVNLTLVDEADFDIEKLKKYFDPKYFFIKLSPINVNDISEKNGLGKGIIEGVNLV